MVNFGDQKGRKEANVQGVRAVFLDLDGAPLQPVLDAGVEPHAIVESSPGKWHVYWQVTGCALDQFKPAQIALAKKFGGDLNVNDLPRVLRVPGFVHQKGEPVQTRIERLEPFQPYAFDYLMQRLGLTLTSEKRPVKVRQYTDPSTGEIVQQVGYGEDVFAEAVERLGRKLQTKDGRRAMLATLVGTLLNEKLSRHQIKVLAVDVCDRYFDPSHGVDWPNVDELISDLAAKDAKERATTQATVGGFVAGVNAPPSDDQPDMHRNAPRPDPACLYGLIGEIAAAGSDTTEANPYAIALNFIAYLSAAVGRGPYMPVGNTWHHVRIFGQHVGRTSRGRKGDAVSIVHRIDQALRESTEFMAPQVHRGGLSSREGLVMLIHDGYKESKNEVEPINDKRLWVVESEFSNVLQQSKRDGNTLSAALRDAWDGVSLKPATKSNRVWATDPHIALSVAITPTELRSLMASRELTNGFANRFLLIWAERTKMLAFPEATPKHSIDAIADKVRDVLRFADADRFVERDNKKLTLTPTAARRYEALYAGELNDQSAGELVNALLERRAPMLLRLAMLFALTDKTLQVDVRHVDAAIAWIRYWCDSVKFVFASAVDEASAAETNQVAEKIIEHLRTKGKATRSELSRDCFQGHASKDQLNAAIDELLSANPPCVEVETVPRPKDKPGSPTKYYSLAAKGANSAQREPWRGFAQTSTVGEISEVSEISDTTIRRFRTDRELTNPSVSRTSVDASQISQI
jgi:hypothetical protein